MQNMLGFQRWRRVNLGRIYVVICLAIIRNKHRLKSANFPNTVSSIMPVDGFLFLLFFPRINCRAPLILCCRPIVISFLCHPRGCHYCCHLRPVGWQIYCETGTLLSLKHHGRDSLHQGHHIIYHGQNN